jgi:hypothetical protein
MRVRVMAVSIYPPRRSQAVRVRGVNPRPATIGQLFRKYPTKEELER